MRSKRAHVDPKMIGGNYRPTYSLRFTPAASRAVMSEEGRQGLPIARER
jgi:hypothetical protein